MNAKVSISKRAGASFPVRRMNFNFDTVPEYWMGGNAGLTHFMTALSALFPAGEKFFIDSVRAVRYHSMLKNNADLQKEISAFIGQEAMHTHEHVGFNASAQKFGHDVDALERHTDTVIQTTRKFMAKLAKPIGITQEMVDLTTTTALEHFTATIASQLLSNSHIQELMTDDTMKTMWLWHAIEENEHKAVVFDVYTAMYGRGLKAYGMRATAMILAMTLIFITQSYFTAQLMKTDRKLTWKDSKYMLKFMYGRQGFITRQIPELLDFFRPNFHPNDSNTDQLLAEWKLKLGF